MIDRTEVLAQIEAAMWTAFEEQASRQWRQQIESGSYPLPHACGPLRLIKSDQVDMREIAEAALNVMTFQVWARTARPAPSRAWVEFDS